MCRWLAYTGSPILLTNMLYTPVHSLIDQSLHSKLGAETTNGDGFGIGWYDACRAEPGLGQDPADCALSGSMAQAEQLALDPAVSPSREMLSSTFSVLCGAGDYVNACDGLLVMVSL
jgi:hypothetical protein